MSAYDRSVAHVGTKMGQVGTKIGQDGAKIGQDSANFGDFFEFWTFLGILRDIATKDIKKTK